MEETLENPKGKEISMGIKQEDPVFKEGCEKIENDEDLVLHFLKKEVCNEPLPPNSIRNINLYPYNPQQLSGMYDCYHYTPTDKMIVNVLLRKKISNEALPPNHLISTIDDFTTHHPDSIVNFQDNGMGEWFIFTLRSPIVISAMRGSTNGFWYAVGQNTKIIVGGETIGVKKRFQFYIYDQTGEFQKSNWTMDEYTRGKPTPSSSQWVLCNIYQTPNLKNQQITAMIYGDN